MKPKTSIQAEAAPVTQNQQQLWLTLPSTIDITTSRRIFPLAVFHKTIGPSFA